MVAVAAHVEIRVIQLQQPVGEEAEIHGDPRHHAATMRAQQRAVVPRFHLRQGFNPRFDDVGDAVQQPRALLARGALPGVEGGGGRFDGLVHLGWSAGGDFGDHGLVDRRDGLEPLGAVDAAACDPVPRIDLVTFDASRHRRPR
jgi:hypothetical protein